MATTVTWTRFNVMLHVHCLPPPFWSPAHSFFLHFTTARRESRIFFSFTLQFKRVHGPIKPQRLFRCCSNLSHRSAPFISHVTFYTKIYLALKWTVKNFRRFNLTHTFTATTQKMCLLWRAIRQSACSAKYPNCLTLTRVTTTAFENLNQLNEKNVAGTIFCYTFQRHEIAVKLSPYP
jgi:hypothetical protein